MNHCKFSITFFTNLQCLFGCTQRLGAADMPDSSNLATVAAGDGSGWRCYLYPCTPPEPVGSQPGPVTAGDPVSPSGAGESH